MKKYPRFVAFLAAVIAVPSFFSPAMVSAAVLPAPTLSSPSSDQVLTNYPRNATFKWSSISGADRYELEVACDVCVSKTNKWQGAKKYSVTGTTFTTKVPGADNQFRWRVRAYDGTTAGNWSAFRYFKYNTKVSTVSAPTMTSPTNNSSYLIDTNVNFAWTYAPGISNGTSYELVIEKQNGSNWNSYKNTEVWFNGKSTSIKMTDSGYFRAKVRAVTNNGGSAAYSNWSGYVYLTINNSTAIAPEILSPYQNQEFIQYNRDITITWRSISGADAYRLEIYRDGYSTETINVSNVTSYSYTALADNAWYHVRVRAMKSGNTYSEWSGYRDFHYQYYVYNGNQPTINNPYEDQIFTNRNVSMSWSSIIGNTGYEINFNYQTDSGWVNQDTYTLNQNQNTYSYYFNYDNTYRMRVRAKLSGGNYSNWSDWREFTVDADYNDTSVGTPTLNSPADESTVNSNYVSLDWSTVSGATSYQYQVTRYDGSSWLNISDNIVTASDASITLNSGLYGQYSFRVRAIKNGYYGNWTDYNQFYYYNGSYTGSPTVYSPSEDQTLTYRNVSMNWSSISGATSYEINFNYLNGSSWTDQGVYTSSQNSYTYYFYNDDNYRMRVRARFSNGTYGNWSDWREFVVDADSSTVNGAPTLTNPAESSAINQNSRNVTLSWNSLSNVTYYEVQAQCDWCSGGSTQWQYSNTYSTYSTSYIWYTPGSDNMLRFRVRAYKNNDTFTDWSDWRTFHYFQTNY